MATLEESLKELLGPLVDDRIFSDVAPAGTKKPYITYQQVGGASRQYLEKKLPEHRHSRQQISVWDERRLDANLLSEQIEKALIEGALISEAIGAYASILDDSTQFRGNRQDFYIWFPYQT